MDPVQILDLETASKYICNIVQTAENGWSAGKIGTSELNALMFYIQRSQSSIKQPYPQYIIREMTHNAGLWNEPNTSIHNTLDSWAQCLIDVLKNIDAIVSWSPTHKTHELEIIKHWAPQAKIIVLRSLESYYTPVNQYTQHMTKGSLAVVSPFADSIKAQWPNKDKIFPKNGSAGQMWPQDLILETIRAPYGPAMTPLKTNLGWPKSILDKGFKEAVNYLADKVSQSGAKYALVGIGALSLLLVHELKKRNIIAIHTGGGTQIMFGVKGNRWSNHSIISGFFNDSWIRPKEDETPSGASEVERSCYW